MRDGLLADVRRVIRLRHYSRRTEQAYVRWVRRFVRFAGLRHPRDLGGREVTAFLTDLAVRGRLVVVVDSGRAVGVIAGRSDIRRFPFPDSLGTVLAAIPSPASTELALLRLAPNGAQDGVQTLWLVTRLRLRDSSYRVVTRLVDRVPTDLWWSSDAILRFTAQPIMDFFPHLFHVPAAGGSIEAEPDMDFAPGAAVVGLSADARRAIVREQRKTTDLWMLTATSRR